MTDAAVPSAVGPTDKDVVTVAVENALIEKIGRLERHISKLENDLRQARSATLDAVLGPLRLREVALVYFGDEEIEGYATTLAQEFDAHVADQVLCHVFDLNGAPVTDEQREAIRRSFNHGMDRW